MQLDAILQQLGTVWDQAITIWVSGGWGMPAIAFVAFIMFALGVNIQLRLREKRFNSVPEKTWRHWISNPAERRGPIGELLDFVSGASTIHDTSEFFDELRTSEIAPFDRELRVMKICVGVAPLLGLLGTVTGMLATFEALASGSGGDKTMELVAKGISEALITTETGLVVALPGVFYQHLLARKYDQYKAFLAHLETVCTQTQYRKLKNGVV